MNEQADIVIIGGGLLGTATAYHLAGKKAGRIILLERTTVASQATARAACLLTRARLKPVLMELVQETYDTIHALEALLHEPLGLQTTGSLTLTGDTSSRAGTEALMAAAKEAGIPFREVDTKEIKSFLPWINPDPVALGVYMPTDGYIDSANLCNAYARSARLLGAEVRNGTGVKEILLKGGEVNGVLLENGDTIVAPVVVNAAGSWANLLSVPLGVGLPMTPVRSHFWITGPNPLLFPPGQPFAVLPDARAFTRADVGGMIIGLREPVCNWYDPRTFSSSIEEVDFSPDNGWAALVECAPLFETYFPAIRTTGIAHYVAGPSCYVPDSMFVAGKIDSIPGLYAVTGCCGAGVATGGGLGRMMAEIITGRTLFVDPSCFDPGRFGKTDPFDPIFMQSCADARSNKRGG